MSGADRPIERLHPSAGETTIASEVRGYDPGDEVPHDQPFVAMNFAATLDGRAAVEGRSGPIGSDVDSALLIRLRTRFDAVMVGAGTLRAERYGRLVRSEEQRAERERNGLGPDPVAVVLSRSLDLPWEAALFTCGEGEVVILTSSREELPRTATRTRAVRFEGEAVDERLALELLRRDHGIRTILCEGGPHLHGRLQASGLVDELFLTLGPRISGGDAPRILEGGLPRLQEAQLAWLLRSDSELMARYRLPDRTEAR